MSDELQAEIDRLKAENARLTRDVADAATDLKETRAEARDRRHENKTLLGQVAELTTDRDRFKAASEADPEGLRKQVADHQSTVRAMRHERAFEKVARTLKVNDPVKYADLLKVAEYAPEGDEPDEAKITTTFQEALKGRPWLVDQPAAGAATQAPGGATGAAAQGSGGKPGPGSERGESVSSTTSQAPARVAGRL